MRARARVTLVALVVTALLAFAPGAPALAASAPAPAAQAPPIAIDLNSLFGDENEPDENEADEGSPQSSQSNDGAGQSGVSLPVVVLLVLAAAAAGGWVVLRVRRLYLRLQAWGRRMWARS
jgi:hypothetical protein